MSSRSPWDERPPTAAEECKWKARAGRPATEGGFFVPPPLAPEVSDYGKTARTPQGWASQRRGWLGARAGGSEET